MSKKTPQLFVSLPVVLFGLALLVLGILTACYLLLPHTRTLAFASKPPSHYLQPGKPIKPFSLTDYNHKSFTQVSLKSKWTFLFFGYTHCPDVCPTTTLMLRHVWNKLRAKVKSAPLPQVVFVSVDPKRDTPDRLKNTCAFIIRGSLA